MEPQPKTRLPQAAPLEPGPVPPQKPGLGKEKSPLTKLGLLIGGAILALGVGAGLYFNNQGASVDQPTQAQVAEMQSSWEAALQSKISLPQVKPEEQKEALAGLGLPEKEEKALQAEVEKERVSLVWVTVWDTYAQDGDVVSLSSEGVNVTVPLLNAPIRVALPRPAGGVFNMTGVKDGNGGITVGLMSGPDQVLIPPMAPGQVVGIPVR